MKENITYSFEKCSKYCNERRTLQYTLGTDEFIDDNALQVNLVRLRKTLARFGLEQRIETVRGQGYRMKG